MGRYVDCLILRGLQTAGVAAGATTVFSSAEFDLSTVPAGFGPLSTGSREIVGSLLIGSLSGSTRTAGFRDPLGSGSAPSVALGDDAEGTLSALFAADPAYRDTARWTLAERALAADETTITLIGPTEPGEGQVVYLGTEAILLGSVSPSATDLYRYSVTDCTRGVCGSRARYHGIDSDSWPAGDDGSRERLTVSDRPLWDDTTREAEIYSLELDDLDPRAVKAGGDHWRWLGYVAERPTQDLERGLWTVSVEHAIKAIGAHRFGETRDLALKFAVTVIQYETVYLVTGGGNAERVDRPTRVHVNLTSYEAERIFRVPLRVTNQAKPDSALVAGLSALLVADARVKFWLSCKVGGHSWVWQIKSVFAQSAGLDIVSCKCDLVASSASASFTDNPRSEGAGIDPNGGFSFSTGRRVLVEFGEEAPTVTLRAGLDMSFPDAARVLLTSQAGDGGAGEFDLLPCGFGAGLDPAWLSEGTAAGTALDADDASIEFEQLAQILDDLYQYRFEPGRETLGDWLRNELVLHCSIWAQAADGTMAPRIWSRLRSPSPAALANLIGTKNRARLSSRVEPLRALAIARGFDPVTLEPKTPPRVTRLPGAKADDLKNALTVRIWKPGAQVTDADLASGPLSAMLAAQYAVALGSPQVYEVPVSLSSAPLLGDLVTWTDATIGHSQGRGFSARPVVVVRVDRQPAQMRYLVEVIEDVINAEREEIDAVPGTEQATQGQKAPGLRIVGVDRTGALTRRVEVTAPAETFNATDSHDAFWRGIADEGARVLVVSLSAHNPDGAGEFAGPLCASATVTGVFDDAGAKRAFLDLSFDATIERGGFTLADICAAGSLVRLQRDFAEDGNPEGVPLSGSKLQDYDNGAGRDFLRVTRASNKRLGPASHKSLIGS